MNAIPSINHSPICARDKYAQTAKVLLVGGTSGTKQPQGKKVLRAHSQDHTGVEIAEFPDSLTVALGNDLRVRLLRIDTRFHIIDSLA